MRDVPNVVMYTPRDPARSCAIANVGIKGKSALELSRTLFENHRFWTVGIDRPATGGNGARITPHRFTTEERSALTAGILPATLIAVIGLSEEGFSGEGPFIVALAFGLLLAVGSVLSLPGAILVAQGLERPGNEFKAFE